MRYVFALLLCTLSLHSFAEEKVLSDGDWLKAHFKTVYKASIERNSPLGKLALELGLLNAEQRAQLLTILREREKKADYSLDDFRQDEKAVAERVIAGLRLLQENNLVVVEINSLIEDSPGRYGVMSSRDFTNLYGSSPLRNSGIEVITNYRLEGEDRLVDGTYVALLEYLEFAHKYDERTKRWVSKNDRWESKESTTYRLVEAKLKEITDFDPHYPYGPQIRRYVTNNLDAICKMPIYDPEMRMKSLPLTVETVIIMVNVNILFHAATDHKDDYPAKVHEALEDFSAEPKLQDYVNFAADHQSDLFLKYGYFSPGVFKRKTE